MRYASLKNESTQDYAKNPHSKQAWKAMGLRLHEKGHVKNPAIAVAEISYPEPNAVNNFFCVTFQEKKFFGLLVCPFKSFCDSKSN